MGINAPQKQFCFAEGTTRNNSTDGAFDEWLTIQNPNSHVANVNITYVLGTGQNVAKSYSVPAKGRITVDVNSDVGNNQDVSIQLNSDIPVVAERPMYFYYHNWCAEGHNVMGVSNPAYAWHFAEGYTGVGYEEWITIQNPNNKAANVTIKYMGDSGMLAVCHHVVGPKSRGTVAVSGTKDVSGDVGHGHNVSADITSDVPIVAERPMYFDYGINSGKNWTGGSDAMGLLTKSYTYYIAEGCTRSGFDTWYTMSNPGTEEASITIKYTLDGGKIVTTKHTIPAQSRISLNISAETGVGQDVSGKVVSDHEIIIERPMYFNYHGETGGHVGPGFGTD